MVNKQGYKQVVNKAGNIFVIVKAVISLHYITNQNLCVMRMLDYQKNILNKVSFDKELFRKELKKSFKWLDKDEIDELHKWSCSNYSQKYRNTINEIFKSKYC